MNDFGQYFSEVADAVSKLDKEQIEQAFNAIQSCSRLFIMGNGGSAASGDHWVCDYMKGINEDTRQFPSVKAISLTSNGPLITAIANDFGYDQIFARQLEYYRPSPQDVVLALTASGNSPNIIQGLYKAKTSGVTTISFTGFNGGTASSVTKFNVHVPAHNYGVVEDVHMMVLHSFSQRLRYWNSYDREKLRL
jgi:D-sedoheptulose 7-phosphate isomerase